MNYQIYAEDYEFSSELEKEKVLAQVSRISLLKLKIRTQQQAESSRKMIVALIQDIRALLIKLSERLDFIRDFSGEASEEKKAAAQEILSVWAPMAGRLGMSSVKDEMEDLSLKWTNPDVYKQLKEIVTLKKNERSEYLEKVEKAIYRAAEKTGISVAVKSRAKHFYSIYEKMRKRNKSAAELYDLLAIRILCDTQFECYTLLGLVHTIWKPIDGRFKDYIAMPKANGYQSLHTTVMCDKKPLEIQIRTFTMHLVADQGAASHWLYKKGAKRPPSPQLLETINKLTEVPRHIGDNEFFQQVKADILGTDIFVLTPKNEVIELPEGSTAVDFAYAIHSAIGEHITGAKADGHIIQLSTPLKTTQTIEILTSPQARPTVNQLSIVKTVKARSKIRAWLYANDPTFTHGEAGAISAKTPQSQEIPQQTHNKPLQNKGAGGLSKPITTKIRIGNTTNFLVSFAHCCTPALGDAIIGYVSHGRGIIVHKENCRNLWRIPNIENRILQVEWEEVREKNQSKH